MTLTALILAASSFAGAFVGQRVKLPAAWMREAERVAKLIADRSAKRAVELHAQSCARAAAEETTS